MPYEEKNKLPQAYLKLPKSLDQALEYEDLRRSNRKKLFSVIVVFIILALISVVTSFICFLHLKNINSPITGYPFQQSQNNTYKLPDITRKPECKYWVYDDNDGKGDNGYWPPHGLPSIKGDAVCFRPRGCFALIEECPPAQEYKKYFNLVFGFHISTIVILSLSLIIIMIFGVEFFY